MTRGRPWLTLKLAASLDGRTAMASGESQWITGANARADVHRLRAAAGCVMTGGATVLADDPQLTVRLPADDGVVPAGFRQPDRVVLDSSARVPLTAKVWHGDVRRFWLVGRKPSAKPDGVEAIEIDRSEEHTSELQSLMRISYAVFCLKKKKHYKILQVLQPHTSTTFYPHLTTY